MACAIICSAKCRRKHLSLEHTKYRWLVFERQSGLITAKDRCGTTLHEAALFLSEWDLCFFFLISQVVGIYI